MANLKKACLCLAAVALAAAIWLPCLHLFFRKPLSDFYQEQGVSPKARQLASRHLQLWTEPSLRQRPSGPAMREKQRDSEKVYENALAHRLRKLGLDVKRHVFRTPC